MRVLHCFVWALLVFGVAYGCYVAKLCLKETRKILNEESCIKTHFGELSIGDICKNSKGDIFEVIGVYSRFVTVKVIYSKSSLTKGEYIRVDNDKICYLMRGDK